MAAYPFTSLGNTTKGVMKNESTSANATVTSPLLSNAVSTSQSPQHKSKCKNLS